EGHQEIHPVPDVSHLWRLLHGQEQRIRHPVPDLLVQSVVSPAHDRASGFVVRLPPYGRVAVVLARLDGGLHVRRADASSARAPVAAQMIHLISAAISYDIPGASQKVVLYPTT